MALTFVPEANRPPKTPVIKTFVSILSEILPTGEGRAPNCAEPYFIVSSPPPSTFDGSMLHADDMADWRISVVAVGVTAEQVTMALDKARRYLTLPNARAAWPAGTGYRVIMVTLDVSRGVYKEERGMPEPVFSDVDFYIVRVTPAPSDVTP